MIFTATKISTDGREFTHHRILETEINFGTFVVKPIIRSWTNLQDAENNSPNNVEFFATIQHESFGENYLENIESQIVDLPWSPFKNQVVVETAPTFDLIDARVAKRAEINAQRDLHEKAGFEYMGEMVDSDLISSIRISAASQAAIAAILGGQEFSVEWVTQDNSTLTLDAQSMVGMNVALASYAGSLHQHANVKKQLIEYAQTEEDLAAIVW